MTLALKTGRAHERTLHARKPRQEGGEDDNATRSFRYRRLMRLSITHEYYNRMGHACPDFVTQPTPATAALMRDLGLLFRSERAGFSVLYDQNSKDDLISYLQRQTQVHTRRGKQVDINVSRLSFTLALNNPYFLNFTALPLRLDPAVQNYYLTNQQAHRVDTERGRIVVLNRGDYLGDKASNVRDLLDSDLLDVVGVELGVVMKDGDHCYKKVCVLDIAGDVVSCKPRCVPRPLARSMTPNAIECKDVCVWRRQNPHAKPCDDSASETRRGRPGDDPECYKVACRNRVFIDFALLPEGKYTLVQIPESGPDDHERKGAHAEQPDEDDCREQIAACCRARARDPRGALIQDVLYTASSPTPLCFVDLLFANPAVGPDVDPGVGRGKKQGIYPVRGLDSKRPRIVPVDYFLRFKNRATTWRYYIVPPASQKYVNMRIQTDANDLYFENRGWIKITNGQAACWFQSNQPILLLERPIRRFQLLGKDTHPGPERVLMAPLPMATVQQVLPEDKIYSDIYVYV